nr:MAG TPA: hypothetical protein [Caudoviricetes sp.]
MTYFIPPIFCISIIYYCKKNIGSKLSMCKISKMKYFI